MFADVTSGVQSWWGPALALAAGVVSFASPCVLPLVPGYLSFVTGENAPEPGKRTDLRPILLFILGFTLVFTIVGAFTAGALSRWLKSPAGYRVAGAVITTFGVFMILYALQIGLPWLYREERPFLNRMRPGSMGALPLGMAFAVGWTPCIGPVLGAILTLAAGQGNTARAVLLLLCYSIGLGIPFLLVGAGVRRLMGAFRFFSRHYRWIAGISGGIMCVVGVLLISGAYTRVVAPLFRLINRFTPAI